MPSPIRLTYSGGTLAEMLHVISSVRPAVRVKMRSGNTYLFYRGQPFGSSNDEEQLAKLLDEPDIHADIVSAEKIEDLFY